MPISRLRPAARLLLRSALFPALSLLSASFLLVAQTIPALASENDPSDETFRTRLLPATLGVVEDIVGSNLTGLALGGIDPISYFLPLGPGPGHRDFEVFHRGLVWRFASRANYEAFLRAPDHYVPAFGGHDGYAAAQGRVVAGKPLIHAILDKRVYLFHTAANRDAFLADSALRQLAHERWLQTSDDLLTAGPAGPRSLSSGG